MFVNGWQINWSSMVENTIQYGVKIGLLVILLAILAPIGKKVISTALTKSTSKQKISEARLQTLEKLLHNAFSYTLMFLFIMMVFAIFEIPIGPLLASAGVVGLAIGFGAQGLVSDVVTGFFILLEKQIDVGDYVTAAGFNGIVEEVGLRTTQIRSFDGTLNFIPNRNISGVSNHSRGSMQALVDIGIDYGDDVDKAMTVLQEVCDEFQADERFVEGPDVIGVQAFGTSEIVLRIIGRTENMEQWGAERDIRKQIKHAFDQQGIEIPYPHQVYIQKDT
ncbi:small-conductance mechanosensitive channel [Gracilibacillus halophilus YIM-C55.5]|uniref:Small-conductance mechanosensitive channel n=1 Tax=Gracilibacillus halophilus YIM-C55.5 TaxID=1308866 RepID=N4WM15_9BACI|nr:mechanosensitive ion channel family protein [Gracilibacillus halophilus]ENH97207.1 small-conductance mechanosensitive channel [Gracilibacillus halophilus YIM-C55.5]